MGPLCGRVLCVLNPCGLPLGLCFVRHVLWVQIGASSLGGQGHETKSAAESQDSLAGPASPHQAGRVGRLWWGAWCGKQHRFPSVGVPCDGGSGDHGVEGWEIGGGETALEALTGALWEEIRAQAPIFSVAPGNIPGGVWPSPTLHGGGDRGARPSLEACSYRSSSSLQESGASLLFSNGATSHRDPALLLGAWEVFPLVPAHLPICQWGGWLWAP